MALSIAIEHSRKLVHADVPRAGRRNRSFGADHVDIQAGQTSRAAILWREIEHHHLFRADPSHLEGPNVAPATRTSAKQRAHRETVRSDAKVGAVREQLKCEDRHS